MTQKEFEERIGRSVTEQEYLEAHAMYMNAGNMEKDEFCREWIKIGDMRLVKCLAETTYQLENALNEHKLRYKEATEIVSDAADAMLKIEQVLLDGENVDHTSCEVYAAELLDCKARCLVGAKEVVLRKIRMGTALTEEDKNYINEHLE